MYSKSKALAFGFGMQGEACSFLRVLVYCLFRRRRGFHGDRLRAEGGGGKKQGKGGGKWEQYGQYERKGEKGVTFSLSHIFRITKQCIST